MDFDQLVTFVEVARQGSFSRAGQKLFRSQPAVSAHVRQLEEQYGQRLLDRAGKSVRLTPAGEVLFEYAERLIRLREESLRAVGDQADMPRGVLSIGANEATCLYVLPEVFAEYHRLYPQVQITIYRNFSRKILQRVEDGTIDVGIVTLPARSQSLRVHSIYRDRLMLMVSSRNALSERKTVTVAEAAAERLNFPKTGFTRQLLDKLFRPYRATLHVTMELPSIGMIKRFVAADLGVSLISEGFARDFVRSGDVKLIPIEGFDVHRELGLVYRRDRSLPRSATSFIELARNGVARQSLSAGQPKKRR
jgi:DNA-binding transcriptional LysR family regulator